MTNVRRVGGALTFCAALLCSCAAAAQALPTPPGGTEPFSGSVRGQAIYSSNVAGGDATVAALRGVTPSDLDYDLGATINLRLNSGGQLFFLSGTADLQRHEKNSVLDSDNYSISTGGVGHLGVCTGTGVLSFNRQETQPLDLTLAVTRNIAQVDGVDAGINCGRGSLFASVQGGYSKITNSATTVGYSDSETSRGSASVGYRNSSFGNLSIGALYSKTDYTSDPIPPFPKQPSFDQYGVTVDYSRRIGLRLSGTANISIQTIDVPATALTPASKPTNVGANASLNYKLSSKTNLTLAYTLANQPSPTVDASYVRVNTLRLSGSYVLNQRITVHMGGLAGRTEYIGGVPIFLQVRRSDDREIDAGISMKIGRKLSVNLDGTHTERQADLSEFSYTANQVTLGLSETF